MPDTIYNYSTNHPFAAAHRRIAHRMDLRFIDVDHQGATFRIWRTGVVDDLGFAL